MRMLGTRKWRSVMIANQSSGATCALAARRPLAAVESDGFGRVHGGVVARLGGCAWVGEPSEQRLVGQGLHRAIHAAEELVLLEVRTDEEWDARGASARR